MEIKSIEELKAALHEHDAEQEPDLVHTLIIKDVNGHPLIKILTKHCHPMDHGVIIAPDDQVEGADHGESTLYPWYRVYEIHTDWSKKKTEDTPMKPGQYL